jgi:hypothetical protein
MFGGHIQTAGIIQNAVISFAASGDNTIVAAVANKRIYIFRLYFILGAASNITFKTGTTALSGALPFQANQGMILDPTECPWHQTDVGSAFILNSSNAVQVSGSVGYIQQ